MQAKITQSAFTYLKKSALAWSGLGLNKNRVPKKIAPPSLVTQATALLSAEESELVRKQHISALIEFTENALHYAPPAQQLSILAQVEAADTLLGKFYRLMLRFNHYKKEVGFFTKFEAELAKFMAILDSRERNSAPLEFLIIHYIKVIAQLHFQESTVATHETWKEKLNKVSNTIQTLKAARFAPSFSLMPDYSHESDSLYQGMQLGNATCSAYVAKIYFNALLNNIDTHFHYQHPHGLDHDKVVSAMQAALLQANPLAIQVTRYFLEKFLVIAQESYQLKNNLPIVTIIPTKNFQAVSDIAQKIADSVLASVIQEILTLRDNKKISGQQKIIRCNELVQTAIYYVRENYTNTKFFTDERIFLFANSFDDSTNMG